MIHAEEAETSLAIALGQRVETDRATRDAWDRGAAVKEAGLAVDVVRPVRDARTRGPGVVVPMDMLRDITESGVVGDATRARRRDRRADRRGAHPPHRPGLRGDGRKGVARWPVA